MIRIEGYIFETLSKPLRENFKPIFIMGETPDENVQFPMVIIEEQFNNTYQPTYDSSLLENHTKVIYLINIYSNLTRGKKKQVQNIADIINKELLKLNFKRVNYQSLSNHSGATVHRVVMRYEAIIGKDFKIYSI